MSSDLRHQLGHLGERLAAAHLERLGYEIVDRNYRTRWGELDIIARDRDTLVFCEVKTRRLHGLGRNPLEGVHQRKRLQVRHMARCWMSERRDRPYLPDIRFDAIGVSFDSSGRLAGIEHLEAAF